MGPWGCGDANANGHRLLEECAKRKWFIAETFIARPPRQKWSFYGSFQVGEGGRRNREYDHFVCSANLMKKSIQDVYIVLKTRHQSDHCLRVMDIRIGGKEFAVSKLKVSIGRALRREDVGEAVNAAIRKAMPGVDESLNCGCHPHLQFSLWFCRCCLRCHPKPQQLIAASVLAQTPPSTLMLSSSLRHHLAPSCSPPRQQADRRMPSQYDRCRIRT